MIESGINQDIKFRCAQENNVWPIPEVSSLYNGQVKAYDITIIASPLINVYFYNSKDKQITMMKAKKFYMEI